MENETKSFVKSLPFKLTNAQRKAAWEIIKNLEKETPMNRMLEGDVGSGKTVVAVIAALNAVKNGYQAILMAPTEILAKQHFDSVKKLFKNFKFNTLNSGLNNQLPRNNNQKITNNQTSNTKNPKRIKVDIFTRTEKSAKINKNEIITSDFIVGTHALIQKNVKFEKLGLVIIDEQHRFGVEQRKKIKEKSENNFSPHFLSMTATPIPRSLALALYGDLDLSIIDEMPENRKKIITKVVDSKNREKAYQFIHKQIKQGRQIFVVCPLIDPFDSSLHSSLRASASLREVKSAEEEYEKIDKQIFPHLRVGLIHGKLKTKEKEQTRKDFWKGKLDILVATAVVEVGIDVPNATVMMIEGADRFGLAQLHQFRGRVGRSEHQSYCFLFTESDSLNTKKRLEALLTAKNGFELAEKDLEIRGPGKIYGTSQSGFISDLKLAKLTDYEIIKKAKTAAEKIIKKDPELSQNPGLRKKIENFEKSAHLE